MTEQTNAVALGLNDLALMANIIRVTSERGAIKANEMEAVGLLYNKLVKFVQANAPVVPTEETVEATEDEPITTEVTEETATTEEE
jgi:hypothetical protein